MTFSAFNRSEVVAKEAKRIFGKRKVWKHDIRSLDEVSFLQVRDDPERVLSHLDTIRRRRPKFICLNDNMNETAPNEEVLNAIHDIYKLGGPLSGVVFFLKNFFFFFFFMRFVDEY